MIQAYLSSRLSRAVAWFGVGCIVYLSLVPASMEVRSGYSGNFEHVLAYACVAGALKFAYPTRSVWAIALFLAFLSCVLEGMQGFVPGRTPLISGALSSGLGAVIGAFAAARIALFDANRMRGAAMRQAHEGK